MQNILKEVSCSDGYFAVPRYSDGQLVVSLALTSTSRYHCSLNVLLDVAQSFTSCSALNREKGRT